MIMITIKSDKHKDDSIIEFINVKDANKIQ